MLLIVPVLILSTTIVFYRNDFMDWLYHEHTNESARVLGILMIAHVFVSSSYISGTLLTAGGHLRHLNLTAGAGLFLNVLLNLILIPELAAYGSAIASMLTQILIMLVQIVLVFSIFGFKKQINLFLRLILFIGILITIAYGSTYLNLPWLLKASGVILITGILAFVFGLIRLPILLTLFSSGSEELSGK